MAECGNPRSLRYEKLTRWIEAFDGFTSSHCAAVEFVNASPSDERELTDHLHREGFRYLLDHRPAALRQFKAPWDRSALEEAFVFRDARAEWGRAPTNR